MSLDLTDDKSTLVQVMAWCRQATSHYLSQCWSRSLSPYGVTRPQWVKWRLTMVESVAYVGINVVPKRGMLNLVLSISCQGIDRTHLRCVGSPHQWCVRSIPWQEIGQQSMFEQYHNLKLFKTHESESESEYVYWHKSTTKHQVKAEQWSKRDEISVYITLGPHLPLTNPCSHNNQIITKYKIYNWYA